MLLPIGLEEARVQRVPWVSIGIAITCVLAYLFTWEIPASPMGDVNEELRPVLESWSQHPYLEPPSPLHDVVSEAALRNAMAGEARNAAPPGASERARQQEELDALAEGAVRNLDAAPMRRLGLVPARGAEQVGWLLHMFLHFGFWHLVGNLFFLYLVGPLLEDVWGRPLFAGFYLVGGLVAALAEVAPNLESRMVMGGASGAVAACMGAFAIRFASQRVRIFYFFLLRWGTFTVAAWVWLAFWFLDEVASALLLGSGAGVAFMAHVGGFAFGAGTAVALRALSVEARWITPRLEAESTWSASTALDEGRAALTRGDRAAARSVLETAVAARPDDRDALLELVRLSLEDGDPAGNQRLEELLAFHLRRDDDGAVRHTLEELGPLVEARALRPATAFRAGLAFQGGPEGVRAQAAPFFEAATAAGGQIAVRAREHLAAVAPRAPVMPLRDLPRPAPRVLWCRVRSLEEEHLALHAADGRELAVPWRRIHAVVPAVLGEVVTVRGPVHDLPVIDLVVEYGGPDRAASALRLPATGLPAAPGEPPLEALARFVGIVVERTGATLLPDRAALAGPPPRYADVAALEAAIYF